MRQVVQSARSGKLALKEVPEPQVKAGHLLVRVEASLISAGTEKMVVDFARKNLMAKAQARPDLVKKVLDKAKRDGVIATFKAVMARLDEPLPLGYSAAGEVIKVGRGLEGAFQIGQKVAIAGAGIANHAEFNLVPRNLATPLPAGLKTEEAAYATLGAIALHGVRNLGLGLGDMVAVLGCGLVGLIGIQLLKASGARVVALDYNPARLELAKTLGTEITWNLGEPEGLLEAVLHASRGLGCDGIFIAAATASSEPLELAADLARDRAKISLVGKTGTEFPFAAFMKKELSLMVSRSYGPGRYDDDFEGRGMKYPAGFVRWTETENLAECIRLMTAGELKVAPLTSHFFDFDKAEAAYQLVTEGNAPHLGVILQYPPQKAKKELVPTAKAQDKCVLGVIGAGNFARTVILPELKGMCQLHSVATNRGMTAEHAQKAFGFAHCTTNAEEIMENLAINGVLIATRHGNHAELTARALKADKNVFVEKPLAVSYEQLNQVITARENSQAFFTVGFNRRFAPLVLKMRGELAKLSGPKVIMLRVNAGALPPETWVNADAEGGGRILGECCHFIDLARFLAASEIETVQATGNAQFKTCDDLAISLRFKDGSIASIIYTAQGDTSFSKEYIEAFAGGAVISLDNYQELLISSGGKIRREKALAQDKGHKALLAAFVAAISKGEAPISETELIETSTATLAVLDALREGVSIRI